ncbi:hypothetical protein ACIA8K_29425 [Catenuloplanes sp. NPDC051500]|uniref:hypothetical protein n=1 Tax=Catenuloplanes sp. NPDC051500 TaxID=3363959 RepID=UPI0037B25F56
MTTVPDWVLDGEQEPEFAVAWAQLPGAPAESWLSRIREWLRPWAPTEETVGRRTFWEIPGGRAVAVADADAEVTRFGGHTLCGLTVGMAPGRPITTVTPALLDLFAGFLGAHDAAYGEIVANARVLPPATALDIALGRATEVSADEAGTHLRGYDWATYCPPALAARVDPAAFARVIAVDGGGLLLVATDDPRDYHGDAVRRVFRAVAPVLPPGRPRQVAAEDLSRLVFADAAGPDSGSAPVSATADADGRQEQVLAFVAEAVANGWITVGESEDLPPEARAVLGDAAGVGLTPAGHRRLAEILAAVRPQ